MYSVCVRVCVFTSRGHYIQPLQTVSAGGGVASALGQATLSAVEHGGRGDDARGRHFAHPLVQLLNLPFLGRLQGLHLREVPERVREGGRKGWREVGR